MYTFTHLGGRQLGFAEIKSRDAWLMHIHDILEITRHNEGNAWFRLPTLEADMYDITMNRIVGLKLGQLLSFIVKKGHSVSVFATHHPAGMPIAPSLVELYETSPKHLCRIVLANSHSLGTLNALEKKAGICPCAAAKGADNGWNYLVGGPSQDGFNPGFAEFGGISAEDHAVSFVKAMNELSPPAVYDPFVRESAFEDTRVVA